MTSSTCFIVLLIEKFVQDGNLKLVVTIWNLRNPRNLFEHFCKSDFILKDLIPSRKFLLPNLMSSITFRTSYPIPSNFPRTHSKYYLSAEWMVSSSILLFGVVWRTGELQIPWKMYTTKNSLRVWSRTGWPDGLDGWFRHVTDVWWAISQYDTQWPPTSARRRAGPSSIFHMDLFNDMPSSP